MALVTLTVKYQGEPQSGVAVLIGAPINRRFTTDANGQVVREVAADFETLVPMRLSKGGYRVGISGFEFVAGGDYVIEVQ